MGEGVFRDFCYYDPCVLLTQGILAYLMMITILEMGIVSVNFSICLQNTVLYCNIKKVYILNNTRLWIGVCGRLNLVPLCL